MDTSLLKAARQGRLQEVCTLLQDGANNANATDEFGRTALILAAQRRYTEIVVELLKRDDNVDVNHQDNNGASALNDVSFLGGYANIVVVLLKRNEIDINLKDKLDRTALFWA